MPLYEVIFMMKSTLTHPETAAVIKEKAVSILNQGGVVRRLSNMGILSLTYPMYRHREKYFKGRHVYMLFDGSLEMKEDLEKRLAQDRTVFRWAVYKQQDNFRDLYDELYYHYGSPKGEKQREMTNQLHAEQVHANLRRIEGTLPRLQGAQQSKKDIQNAKI